MELGVVGVPMLVQKVEWLARDIPHLVVRPLTYETMLDAPRIAAENQEKVEALYFAGTSPYFLAASVVQPLVPWYYQEVPIEGLPFALFAARDFFEEKIRFSIDTLADVEIEDTLRDFGCNIGSIYTYPFRPSERYDDDVLDFHLSHYRGGRVAFCLTCAYVVHKKLAAMDIPAFFVEPTYRMIRKTLNALLRSQQSGAHPANAEPSKLVVGLYAPDRLPASVNLYEGAVRSIQKAIFSYAKKRDVLVFQRNASMFQCVQTYAQFRLETENFRKLPLIDEFLEANPDARIRVGYGVAANIKSAEQYAEEALDMGLSGEPYLFDGEKGWALGDRSPIFTVTDSDPVFHFYSRRLEVTPATFSRYLRAFKLLSAPFSSSDFSKALGLQPKSSRKILARFLKERLIALESRRAPLAKGRPESLYRLHPEMQTLMER